MSRRMRRLPAEACYGAVLVISRLFLALLSYVSSGRVHTVFDLCSMIAVPKIIYARS
jgi:hypothetical protein